MKQLTVGSVDVTDRRQHVRAKVEKQDPHHQTQKIIKFVTETEQCVYSVCTMCVQCGFSSVGGCILENYFSSVEAKVDARLQNFQIKLLGLVCVLPDTPFNVGEHETTTGLYVCKSVCFQIDAGFICKT